MDITNCFDDCSTLKEVFESAHAKELKLYIFPLDTGLPSFSILSTQKDYAIIDIPKDRSCASISGKFIHPYGSSIGYDIKRH